MNHNQKMTELYGYAEPQESCNHCKHCSGTQCDLAGKINRFWIACGKFVLR